MASPPIVDIDQVHITIDGQAVLQDVSLRIVPGDFLAVIGPNGGGKTTLLKLLLGVIRPQQGEVRIFGAAPQDGRSRIGYVPQGAHFDRNFPITVWDVVLLGRLPRRRAGQRFNAEDRERAREALERVEMYGARDRQIGRLSGGERQRVFIARALVSRPELLLLDEPTASVDPPMQTGIYDLLSELKKYMAILLVTHDVGVISSHVEKIACLNGRLFYHDAKEIKAADLEAVYQCPVDIIAHGVPHRVLKGHGATGGEGTHHD